MNTLFLFILLGIQLIGAFCQQLNIVVYLTFGIRANDYIIQIFMQLSSNLSSLFKNIQNTIIKLQSDEIIQQMRNDSSLYSCKMKYIQQLIEEQMNSCQQLAQNVILVQTLQEKLKERQYCIERMKNQYAVQLENIEHNCRQLINDNQKKLREKDQYLAKYKHESQIVHARSQSTIQNMREQLSKSKLQNSNLRQDRKQLQHLKYDLQGRIQQLTKEGQNKERYSEETNRQIHQLNKKLNQAEQVIVKMQNDMKIIKQSWEKRCFQLENMHQQELAYKAIQYQQKFKRELNQCADTLKMGNSVVYSENEEVVSKKIELVERSYKSQINSLADQIKQFQQQLFEVKEQINQKEEIIRQLQANLEERQNQYTQTNKQLSSQIKKKQRELEQLTSQINQLTKEAKSHRNQNQQALIESKQLKQQIRQLNKKHEAVVTQCVGLQQQVETYNKKIMSQNVKIDECMSQLCANKEEIIQKEQQISANQAQILKLKTAIDAQKETEHQQKELIEAINLKAKREKEKRRKLIDKLDKLSLIIRKISKESQLLREEVTTTLQIINNKLVSQFSLLHDTLTQKIESLIRKHKAQMCQLLDQMEQKQKEMVENLAAQKQQMKVEIKEYLQIIKTRDSEIYNLKGHVSDLQQVKKELLMDLQNQKILTIRIQQKIQSNQQAYADNIHKVQKDVSRTMTNFSSYWSEQIGKVQQQLDSKDSKIKHLNQKIEQLLSQGEQIKKQRAWIEDQVRKYKKKYENLKHQRDQKIQSLLKKLQQQGKHRINLQKELKQVRMTVMKGTYQSNNNFSFNDNKQRESNNKAFTTSIKQDQNRQRQRQLSQIREMIAKTYKVVDGPAQRDLGRNFSKKTLF